MRAAAGRRIPPSARSREYSWRVDIACSLVSSVNLTGLVKPALTRRLLLAESAGPNQAYPQPPQSDAKLPPLRFMEPLV